VEKNLPVDVLVEGHWLRGNVAHLDGFGVALDRESGSQSVVRIEAISAVTVGEDATQVPRLVPQQGMTMVR
jgi:sRNA-binding regulator protein Hfq